MNVLHKISTKLGFPNHPFYLVWFCMSFDNFLEPQFLKLLLTAHDMIDIGLSIIVNGLIMHDRLTNSFTYNYGIYANSRENIPAYDNIMSCYNDLNLISMELLQFTSYYIYHKIAFIS